MPKPNAIAKTKLRAAVALLIGATQDHISDINDEVQSRSEQLAARRRLVGLNAAITTLHKIRNDHSLERGLRMEAIMVTFGISRMWAEIKTAHK